MIKYLVPLAGLLFLLVVVSAQQDGEKSDLEASEFLFRPVYIRYGYHPHNSYGWKGGKGVQHGGWSPHGYGWGSYHLHGWDKKGGKKHKKAKKKAQKKKKKAYKKKSKKGGWGWPGGNGGGGGGYGGYGGGGQGGGWGWGGGGYGGFEE